MSLLDKAFDNSEDMTKAKLWDGQNKTDMEIPRRNRVDLNTPAELAIRNAIEEVEKAGAHPLLTKAVQWLADAKELVSDYEDLPKPHYCDGNGISCAELNEGKFYITSDEGSISYLVDYCPICGKQSPSSIKKS